MNHLLQPLSVSLNVRSAAAINRCRPDWNAGDVVVDLTAVESDNLRFESSAGVRPETVREGAA
jgi:hypothetical protein